MSAAALIMMVAVLTTVWGGFAVAVATGVSRERRKNIERQKSATAGQGTEQGGSGAVESST